MTGFDTQPSAAAQPPRPTQPPAAAQPPTDWLGALNHLRETRTPGVLVTLVSVRGHAPRDAGAKMVVTVDGTYDTIGGGNLEMVAVERAREWFRDAPLLNHRGDPAQGLNHLRPETIELHLSDKATHEHGVQCCGGEVTVLLEPIGVVPSIAIFGMGHVGRELAHILVRHDIDLHLVDSRGVPQIGEGRARVHTYDDAVLPELAIASLPKGTQMLVMTHDHADDLAICDAALRAPYIDTIGLIGSSGKWSRFQKQLRALGHDDLSRIVTPIGMPSVVGKEPEVVALSVAADLVSNRWLGRERSEPRNHLNHR